MLAVIDEELEKLTLERERLQPLEVNLQAAAGRTAHARAALSKAKEKRTLAASELRAHMEKYKLADKDVVDAENKLAAAEAAATAKRSEVKISGVHDAVELLRQTATAHCADEAVAKQLAAAIQQIADVLGSIEAAAKAATATGAEKPAGASEQRSQETPAAPTGGSGNGYPVGTQHAVFAACGASDAKSRRVAEAPMQRSPVAHSPPPAAGEATGDTAGREELFAGGAVDGEVAMGGGQTTDDADLLAQAAAVLGDGAEDL